MISALKKYFGLSHISANMRAPKHIQKQIMDKAEAKAQRKLARTSLDGTVGWYRGR